MFLAACGRAPVVPLTDSYGRCERSGRDYRACDTPSLYVPPRNGFWYRKTHKLFLLLQA